MKIEVEMHAFMDGAIRVVDVPDGEAAGADEEALLDLAFKWGQNDFQPQRMCSVSVGDVVRLGGKRFRVAPVGFEEAGERAKCATCGGLYPLGAPRCPDNECGREERTLCQAQGCDLIECCEVATGTFRQDGHTFDACGEHRDRGY